MTYSILFSSHRLLKILYVLAILALVVAFVWPRAGQTWFTALEPRFQSIARKRWQAVLIAALFPMLVRVCMLPWYPPPPPQIHDEFSYLLQGDTFAHERAVNPTPPYWEHFETEYTLLQPTYASQYQPAQGLVLAFGEVLFQHPWWGVWLSVGVMCGALCWALGEIVPLIWAFAGAIGAGLQFGIFGLWMNSYFGGAVAATAGALVIASLARIRRRQNLASSAALCAFGIILTFATRPFEGVLWTVISAGFVSLYALRSPSGARIACFPARLRNASPCLQPTEPRRSESGSAAYFFRNLLLPFVLVFSCGAGLLAWYNWRVTGNPADPPYLAYQRTYGTPQPFWWQQPVIATGFRHRELRDNYLNQVRLYNERYSAAEMLDAQRKRLANFWRFFVGPFLTPALLFLPWIWRDRRIRPWLLISIPFIAAKASYHAWYPAHSGPETILIVLVLLACWRHMRVSWRRRQTGIAMSRMLVSALCLAIVFGNAGRAMEPVLTRHGLVHLAPVWESLYPAKRLRDEISTQLARIPGKHLVFVKYGPKHCFCEEWVFNSAELSEQRIIYARPYTLESDQALAQSFPDHDVWVIEPDRSPYSLARLEHEAQWARLDALTANIR